MLCEISLFVPSGTALAIDGETGELNRKFFATEVSNMYAKSKCDADQVQTPQLTPQPLAPGPSTSAMPSASLFAGASSRKRAVLLQLERGAEPARDKVPLLLARCHPVAPTPAVACSTCALPP
jgi:hypothetical protein